MAELPRPSVKDMVRSLEREGFTVVRIRDSHHYLSGGDQRTSVPIHANRALKIGTLRSILRAIDMTPEESSEGYGD